MKIFISWSGGLSQQVALIVREWLPQILQPVRPFMSSEDIRKGARWFSEISRVLDECQFGILCITRENLTAPWILFEAGALAKRVDQAHVVPLLVDVEFSDLRPPLSEFMAVNVSEETIWGLVKTIYERVEGIALTESQLRTAFDSWWWPTVRTALSEAVAAAPKADPAEKKRSERDMLEEMLALLRSMNRTESRVVSRRVARSQVEGIRPSDYLQLYQSDLTSVQ